MTRTYIFLILLMVLNSSCSKELPENTIYSIPDEFDISIHQIPTSQGIQPSFLITTKSHFECSNADLKVELISIDQKLKINISDIIENSNCNFNPGKLQEEIFAFLANGRYGLEIKLKNAITNQGALVVSDKKFSFEMETTHGFEIITGEVNKIPRNYLWVVVKAKNTKDMLLAEKLRKEIAPYTEFNNDLSPGNYGIFIITDNNTIVFKDIPVNNTTEVFIYKLHEEGGTEVSRIIKLFQENHPEIEIKAATTREQIL